MSSGSIRLNTRDQFIPIRNTQYSRHKLLKKQREQILKLREINLVAHNISLMKPTINPFYCLDKNCQCLRETVKSAPNASRERLPKAHRSPYADSRSSLTAYDTNRGQTSLTAYNTSRGQKSLSKKVASNNYSIQQQKTKSTSPTHNNDVNGLRQCYRRICNDDVESFRMLLKNQSQFGKPKIPLVVTCHQRHSSTFHGTKCLNNNSFPRKQAPYVPRTFLRSNKKKPVSPSFTDQLITNNKPVIQHSRSAVSVPADQKPKLKEPSITVDSPDNLTRNKKYRNHQMASTSSNSEYSGNFSMSREEFISINEELLGEDLMAVPNSGGLILSRSSSSVSNIIEEMIKEKKIKIVDDRHNTDDATSKNSSLKIQSDGVTDKDIASGGVFTAPPIDLEVLDENGEKKSILWHDPEAEHVHQESSEALLDSSKSLAAKRKSELKQLLEEYSEIAQELDKMEVK